MRGRRSPHSSILAFVNLDDRVSPNHPLWVIERVAQDGLDRISDDFERMYLKMRRASVLPKCLFKASMLISLHSVRSELVFCIELPRIHRRTPMDGVRTAEEG